jgi:hypothetical protein
MAICYILWSFGIFLPILVFCTKKNLATLVVDTKRIIGKMEGQGGGETHGVADPPKDFNENILKDTLHLVQDIP